MSASTSCFRPVKAGLLCLVMCCLLTACAPEPENPAKSIILAMDRNHSNEVSWEEFSHYHEALFARLDINHDGYISGDEFKALNAQGMRSLRLPRMDMTLSMFDKDGDGKLSHDEFQRMGDRLFTLLDKNNDGLITEDDFASLPSPGGMHGMPDDMSGRPPGGMGGGGGGMGMPRW